MAIVAVVSAAACLGLLLMPVVLPVWLPTLAAVVCACFGRLGITAALVAVLGTVTLYRSRDWKDSVLPAHCEGTSHRLVGEVRGLVEQRSGVDGRAYLRFRFATAGSQKAAAQEGACGTARNFVLYWSGSQHLLPGDQLILEAKLKQPWGLRNPGGRSAQTTHFINRIHATGSVREILDASPNPNPSFIVRIDRLRSDVSAAIHNALQGDTGALMAALLVGDRRTLEDHHWERLRGFGLTHLLVISGLHVSIVATLGWCVGSLVARCAALLGMGLRRRALACVLALALSVFYALLAGFALPVMRALLMLFPALLMLTLGRGGSAGRLLCFALLALLLVQPEALLGSSIWLSCGAVALLLWAGKWRRAIPALRRVVFAQGFMVMAMAPLSLYWFAAAGTLGALSNLVAVPLISLWVVPIGLIGVAVEGMSNTLSGHLWILAAMPLQWLWRAMEYWLPLLDSYTLLKAQPSLMAVCLAVLGALMLPLPGGLRRLFICLALQIPLLLVPHDSDDATVRVTVLDVGQGTAVFARSSTHAMLYDTGGGLAEGPNRAQSVILPFLRSIGVSTLDLLVISHLDLDHSAGLKTLQSALRIGETWSGPSTPWARQCRLGRSMRFGADLVVRTLSSAQPGDNDNNSSCVIALEAQDFRMILPGDIDRTRERQLLEVRPGNMQFDVLLAAHHGSSTSSSRLWLKHVQPAHIVFTAGRGNRFGHPSEAVVEAAIANGAILWNTAEHGALRLRIHNGNVSILPERHRWRPFWWLWQSSMPRTAYSRGR